LRRQLTEPRGIVGFGCRRSGRFNATYQSWKRWISPIEERPEMPENRHFEPLASWEAARERVGDEIVTPRETAGFTLSTLSLFVRDYKMREVSREEQSLEAHYGAFVFTQSKPGREGARRAVCEVSYGSDPASEEVLGCEARVYEMGPEVDRDDPDGRMPAVVVWAEGERFFLIASDQLSTAELLRIARSVE
jgi:hypothetical protein